ncbi:MAG: 16S rRNA (cytidine(1402)-2'-O)-methyltransferase [Planctomycetes bacterium]|nr:16S rRNA (cytidine(1402)-2'-O)-methyltransferase [Planctomycetota bacterium]
MPDAVPPYHPLMPGTLYVVGTPIGNLEDISLRALRVLREVDAVVCEDTRTTWKLLKHHGLDKSLVALYGRSGRTALSRLQTGDSLALVSESGTPGISDPGARLVAEAHDAGIAVRAIPGPCALIAAASVGGLPADRFVFEGFLRKRPGQRRRRLHSLAREERTLIFYESPHRVAATLAAMREAWGNRRIAIARELTKVFEEIRLVTIDRALEDLARRPPRGEYVLVVEGAVRARGSRPRPEEE